MKRSLQRWLSLLLAFCFLPVLPGLAAYEESAYTLTGDGAADIVGIALTQVGYTEGTNNANKYGEYFGNANASWCGYFVAWCAEKAGIPAQVVPRTGSTSGYLSFYQQAGRYQSFSSGYTPKKGDLIFFDWDGNGVVDHMGIVRTVDADGSIHLLDGNYSNRVNDRMLTASATNQYMNFSCILGYGIPDYASGGSAVPTPTPDPDRELFTRTVTGTGSGTYYQVTTSSTSLNLRVEASTSSARVGSVPKGTLLLVTETAENGGYTWGKTVYQGITGWCALSYCTAVAAQNQVQLQVTYPAGVIAPGEQVALKGGITPAALAAQGISWSSSDPSVATVSASGIVTALQPGSVQITLRSAFADCQDHCTVTLTVGNASVSPTVGDLNQDGTCSVADVVLLRKLILEDAWSESQLAQGDLNQDSNLSVSDVVLLRNLILTQS